MRLGAFRPHTTTEDKKSLRSSARQLRDIAAHIPGVPFYGPFPSSLLHARLLCCYEAHTDLHFHACPEQVKDRHKAVDSEAAEIRVADAGEIGRGNSGEPVRAAHAQTFPVHRLHDFGCEDRLELLSVRAL